MPPIIGQPDTLRFSDQIGKWLPALEEKGRKFSKPAEEQALADMTSEIDRERDPGIKQFMEDFLLNFSDEAEVLPSVVREYNWGHTVSKERALAKSFPTQLYVEIEDLLSRHVWSGYARNNVVRYPLTISHNRPGKRAVKNVDSATTSPSKMLEAHYNFGSNTYHVGRAIECLLKFFEGRYMLQIERLEAEYQQREVAKEQQR